MPNYKHLKYQTLNWYHFDQGLTESDQALLAKTYGFSQEDLDSCQHRKTQRPKVKTTKKYVYLIFHIPYRSLTTDQFSITELNIFITKTGLVTIESTGDLNTLNEFVSKTASLPGLVRQRFKAGTIGLFSRIILVILNSLIEEIDDQGEEIDRLHHEIFSKQLAKKFVETVSTMRYNQVVTHNALERQNRIYEQFRGEKNPLLLLAPKAKTNWNKILDTLQMAQFEVESDMDHLEGLVRTFESLISFHTNKTIKLLTTFSVILLPLSLIASIYGMNFDHLPFGSNPFGFVLVITIMLLNASVMTIVFKLKHWI